MHKFKNKNRQGAQALAKYGYVEYGEFRNMVIKQLNKANKVYGYFCANCKFFGGASQNGEYKLCTKLQNAEVADYGCCNLWEFKEAKPEPAPAPEAPVAAQKAVPKPAPKVAPKPVPKVAPASQPVKESSAGKLDGDTSDALENIVAQNKAKLDAEILRIARKLLTPEVDNLSDKELVGYIQDLRKIHSKSAPSEGLANMYMPPHLKENTGRLSKAAMEAHDNYVGSGFDFHDAIIQAASENNVRPFDVAKQWMIDFQEKQLPDGYSLNDFKGKEDSFKAGRDTQSEAMKLKNLLPKK